MRTFSGETLLRDFVREKMFPWWTDNQANIWRMDKDGFISFKWEKATKERIPGTRKHSYFSQDLR